MIPRIRILFGLEAAGGGALKHVAYLIFHLNKNIFDITLVYSSRTGDEHEEINRLKLSGIRVIKMQMSRNISLLKDLACLIRITKFLSNNEFDIVHAHSSKSGFYFRVAAWLNRVPVIAYTPHCFYFQAKSGIKRLFFEFAERSLACITHTIVVSESERMQGLKSGIAPAQKFVNINNAIDFNDYAEYERASSLKHLGLSEDAVVVGAVGRLVQQKDLLILIWAAKKLIKEFPNLYVVIAGKGEQDDLLRAEITNLGLTSRVLLLGHQFAVGKIFSAIDIFVSTSLWEGLPYVILEAMFYKKPIVATDIGYHDVLTDKENCYLVPVKNVPALCEKLSLLINNKELRDEFGRKSRVHLNRNFLFRKFVSLHEQLYINEMSR